MGTFEDILSAIGGAVLPGGAMALSRDRRGDWGFPDVTPGFSLGPQGASALYEPYRATMSGHAAQRFLGINPTTSQATWFGPLGKPVLFSGDFAAVRRVRRVAARARRRVGGR